MITFNHQQRFEEKVRAMMKGFRGVTLSTTEFNIRGEKLIPGKVLIHLKEMTDLFESIREHRSKHREAVAACNQAMEGYRAFFDEAAEVVKAHYGSDSAKMASFGLETAKHGKRSPRRSKCASEETITTEVIEVVVEERRPSPRPERRPKSKKKGGSR